MKITLVIFFLAAAALAQITEQKSNTEENLRGISAVSPFLVWASGTHGTFLRTGDGGKTWEVGHVPGAESLDFRDVEAFSADDAYLLAAGPGEQSRIYKTADAGKNWTLQFTNHDPKGFFDCMAFWDRDHGIAVGDPVDGKFQLIKTENGGKEWKPIPPEKLPPALEGEGAFAASGTCIAVQGKKNVWFVTGGSAARVFRSTDAGESWSVAETPIVHGSASAGIFSIAVRDESYAVIAGGDYKEPEKAGANLAISSDGGLTWTLASLTNSFYFSVVAFMHDRSIAALGSAGVVVSSPNLKRWESFSSHDLNALAVMGGNSIAVGAKGIIVALVTSGGPAGDSSILILSDVGGVDVSGVVNAAALKIKRKWFQLAPAVARAPFRKQGLTVIDFALERDGSITGVKLVDSSKDSSMDEAAWRSVIDSSPVEPLPSALKLSKLHLRLRFAYNLPAH